MPFSMMRILDNDASHYTKSRNDTTRTDAIVNNESVYVLDTCAKMESFIYRHLQ